MGLDAKVLREALPIGSPGGPSRFQMPDSTKDMAAVDPYTTFLTLVHARDAASLEHAQAVRQQDHKRASELMSSIDELNTRIQRVAKEADFHSWAMKQGVEWHHQQHDKDPTF